MSAKVIAPDLGVYYEYGINYSKAGAGKVSMPKVATITMTFNDAEPGIPMGDYHLGDVTITDESGTNGSITTNSTLFKSKLVAEDITFFW
jgi:hypothetical protein